MQIETEQPAVDLPDSSAAAAAPPDQSTEIDSELDPNGQPDPDEIEEELEGIKLRGKKDLIEKLRSERLMQADYTRKTQEVAEQRRAQEQERETFQQVVKFQEQFQNEIADFRAIERRVNLIQNHLRQNGTALDPSQAQNLLLELNQLQADKAQLGGSLTQKRQQWQLYQQHESAKRANEAEAIVASVFKDWSPTRLQALVEYAQSEGATPQQLTKMLVDTPHFAKTINKALMWDRHQKQIATKAPPPPPVGRVGGGSASNSKPLSEVTDPREWQKRRQEWKTRNR